MRTFNQRENLPVLATRTFAELPVTFVERRLGESTLSQAVLLESAITPWRLIAARTGASPAVL